MADYSIDQLKAALAGAGATGPNLDVATAVSLAEDTSRTLVEVNTAGNTPAGSRDRGPYQINDYWHADVPDSCAFDLGCGAKAMARITNNFTDFSPYTTYKSGAYLSHLADASSAPIGSTPTATLTNLGPIPTPSDAVNSVIGAVRTSLLTAVFFAGGLGLVVAGLWRSTSPVRSKVKAQQDQVAQQAGPALAAVAMA